MGRVREDFNVKLGARVAVLGRNVGDQLQARVVILLDVSSTETARSVPVTRGVALLLRAGMDAFRAGQNARAIKLLQSAMQAGAASNDGPGEGLARNNLGLVLNESGQPELALQEFARALLVQRRLNDAGGQGLVLYNMTLALSRLKRSDEAAKTLQQATDLARQGGDPKVRLLTLSALADSIVASGPTPANGTTPANLTRAGELYDEALPLARAINDTAREADLSSSLAVVRGLQGQGDLARKHASRAETLLPNVTDPPMRGAILETLASAYSRGPLRDLNRRRDLLTQAIAAYESATLPKLAERARTRLSTPPSSDLPFNTAPDAAPAPPTPDNANGANNGGNANGGAMNGGNG